MRSAHGVYCNRARERAGTGIFRRVVASCVERSKSRLLPRRPSARIPTKAKLFGPQPPSSFSRFAPSSSFRPPLSYVRVSTYAWRTRVRVFRCTRVRVDTSLEESLQTEFRFALRVSISHATWSSVFYSSPWDVRTLSPFPGAFRERATTNVVRRVARSYTCAQSGSQFERVSGLKIVSRGSRVT